MKEVEQLKKEWFGPKQNIITLKGRIIWKNTDGYLSAEFRTEMKFFLTFAVYYTVMCIVWMYMYVNYKE